MGEYTEEFNRLGARLNLVEGEQYRIARYISGLKQDIQENVEL